MSEQSEYRHVIFQIEMRGIDRMHVMAVAANEIEFEVVFGLNEWPELFEDVCKAASAMMNVDAALQEENDGSDVHPSRADRRIVREFMQKYQSGISSRDLEMLGELC
jgi:hypothetical protein